MKSHVFFTALSTLFLSCNSGKIVVNQSVWQRTIQAVVPEHQCVCDTSETARFPYPKNNKRNLYLWQRVITTDKNEDSLLRKAERVKEALVNLVPVLKQYPYFYIEFIEPFLMGKKTKYKTIGTAYFVKEKCNGYLKNFAGAELAQRVNNRPFLRKKLCIN